MTFIYNATIYVTFLLFEILVFILSLIVVGILYKKVSFRIVVKNPVAEANCLVKCELVVENQSWIPCLHSKVLIECKNTFSGEKNVIRKQIAVESKQEKVIEFCVENNACGVVEIRIKKAIITDLFGFLRFRKKYKDIQEVLFLPEFIDMDMDIDSQMQNVYGESDVYDKNRPGDDPSEIFEVRDYRLGDRLQKVHWKATAKNGSLMVKENSRPLACGVVVLVDLLSKREDIFENGARVVTLLLSYSLMLLRKQCYHYVAWYDKKENQIVRYPIREESDIENLMNVMLRMHPYVTQVDLEELYNENYKDNNQLKKYIFSMDEKMREGGNVLWDGELLYNNSSRKS